MALGCASDIAADPPNAYSTAMITVPPETEELARRVAARRGSTPEDVVRAGVEIEAQIAGVAVAESKPRKEIDLKRVREIIRNVSSAPLRDTRSPKEILDEAWGALNDRGG
jgi:hypothetical protein